MGGKFGNRGGGKKTRRKLPRYARPPDKFPKSKIKDLANPNTRIRAQVEFLEKITRPVKQAAGRFYDKTKIWEKAPLEKLEREMLEIVRAYPDDVPPSVLSRAERIFDRAYELGESGFDNKPIWREAYRDPVFRQMLEEAREAGLVRYSEETIRQGKAPQLKNRIANKWTRIDLDHWPPRERTPFKSFDGESLAPVTVDTNQYRKLFSEGSGLPMGSGPGAALADEIEDFALRNNLVKSHRKRAGKAGSGSGGLSGGKTSKAPNDAGTSSKTTGDKGTDQKLDATPKAPKADLPTAKVRTDAAGFTKSRLSLRRTLSTLGNAVSTAFPDPLDLVTQPLRLGLVSGLVVGFAVEIMFFLLERKLAKLNAEGIAREYRSKVYEGMRVRDTGQTLKAYVEEIIQTIQTDETDLAALGGKKALEKVYGYAEYEYDILFEMQAETFADGLICVLRGFRFVEVYQNVEPRGEVTASTYSSALSEKKIMRQKRKQFSDKNLVRYRCRHRMLLWDPKVHQTYILLWNRHYECISELKKILAATSGNDADIVGKYANQIARLVRQYRFLDTINLLAGEHKEANRMGALPAAAKERFKPVAGFAKTGDQLVKDAKKLQSDRRNLMLMFAGTDIFASRRNDAKSHRKFKAAKAKPDPFQFAAPFSRTIY